MCSTVPILKLNIQKQSKAFEDNYSNDPGTGRSRMGYIIQCAGCPMNWASKMQTEIALSTPKAKYIALSQSMREVLPIMWLLQEAYDHGITVLLIPSKIHCKSFKEYSGAIEIAGM
jgi:hypothetical protein